MRTRNKPIFLAQIAYCTDFLTVFLSIVQRNLNPSFPLAGDREKNTQCLTSDLCSVLTAVEEAERGPQASTGSGTDALTLGRSWARVPHLSQVSVEGHTGACLVVSWTFCCRHECTPILSTPWHLLMAMMVAFSLNLHGTAQSRSFLFTLKGLTRSTKSSCSGLHWGHQVGVPDSRISLDRPGHWCVGRGRQVSYLPLPSAGS